MDGDHQFVRHLCAHSTVLTVGWVREVELSHPVRGCAQLPARSLHYHKLTTDQKSFLTKNLREKLEVVAEDGLGVRL